MELICWILISICCFYLLRNIYVGSILYPITSQILENTLNHCPRDIRQKTLKHFARRNYYLVVLNPFWWRVADVFKEENTRRDVKNFAKILRNLK